MVPVRARPRFPQMLWYFRVVWPVRAVAGMLAMQQNFSRIHASMWMRRPVLCVHCIVHSPLLLKHQYHLRHLLFLLMETWASGRERAAAVRPRRTRQNPHEAIPQNANSAIAAPVSSPFQAPHGGRPQGPTWHSDKELLHATARLSIETARNVRMLTAIAVRTLSVPALSQCGPPVRAVAEQPRTYAEHEPAYTWAQLVLLALALVPEDSQDAGHLLLRQHAVQSTRPELLRDHLQECQVTRCYSADASNIKLAVSGELAPTAQALCRTLIAGGATLRFGAAPKSSAERAVTTALTAALRH